MSTPYRRFEILLPLRFNDGLLVPDALFGDTLLEMRERFGAISSETQVIRGQWQHQGDVYRDEMVRIFVDTEDLSENRAFFVQFKDRLKQRFQQLDIWLTSHPIDVL